MRFEHYKLNKDKIAIPCTNIESAEYKESAGKHVAYDEIGGYRISTIFLGTNHQYDLNNPKPILFETMIFGDYPGEYQERYSTYDEAIEGHYKAKNLVLSGHFKTVKQSFTTDQIDYICARIGDWYNIWHKKIARGNHRLGMAKEELKTMICGE